MSKDKLRVLIVDDEEDVREPLAEWLERSEEMAVDTAAKGEEALTKIQIAAGTYDAVLLDEVLPGIDGIQTLEQIKSHFPNIQVIMFTGQSPEAGIEALRKGAYRYILKPPRNEEIAHLLRHIGEIRELERQKDLAQQEVEQDRLRRQREENMRAFPAPVSLAFEFDQVAKRILDDLRNVIEYRKASLQLVRGDTRMLLAGAGFDPHKSDRWLLRPVSQDPLISRAVKSKEPLILSYTHQDPHWQQSDATFDVHSWVGLPLVYDQEVVGLITMDHDQAGFYTEAMRSKLLTFAQQTAMDVQRVRFFDSAQRRIRDLEILNQVVQIISTELDTNSLLATIAEQVMKHLNCTHCTLFFKENENGQTILVPRVTKGEHSEKIMQRRFRPGEGLAGWIFEMGQSYISSDVHNDPHFVVAAEPRNQPRSMLVVPIKVGERTIGVLSADQDAYGWFSENDLRLVEALTWQAGIAIERAEGLRLVRDIGSAIIGTQKIEEILQRIVFGAIELTDAVTGVIYLLSEDQESIASSFVHPPDFDRPPPRMTGEGGLTRKIIKTGEIEEILDIQQDEGTNPKLLELGFRSMIGIPLKLEGRVIGVLYLNDNRIRSFTETEKVLLTTLAGQAAIAIQNAMRFTQLTGLYQASQMVLAIEESPQSTRGLLQSIAQDALKALRADLVDIYEYRQDQKQFINLPQVTAGERKGGFVGTQKIYEDDAIFELLHRDKPEYIEQAQSYPAFVAEHSLAYENQPEKRFVFREEIHSCAVIPLMVGDETVGFLFANYRTPQQFKDEQKSLIELFANYAAIAIRNSRLYEGRIKDISVLKEISQAVMVGETDPAITLSDILQSVVDKLNGHLGAISCAIRLYDFSTNQYGERVAAGVLKDGLEYPPRMGGTSEYILKSKQPIYAENPSVVMGNGELAIRKEFQAKGIQSIAYLPLLSEEEVIGILHVEWGVLRSFHASDRQVLELFARYATVAIKNAQLYESIQKRNHELELLNRSSQRFNSTLDPNEVLKSVLEDIREVLKVRAASVWLVDAETQEVVCQYNISLHKDIIQGWRLSWGTGIVGWVIENDQSIIVSDTRQDKRHFKGVEQKIGQEFRSILCVPLQTRQGVIGAIQAVDTKINRFAEDDRMMLESLAMSAAAAIKNARLFEQSEQQRAQVEEKSQQLEVQSQELRETLKQSEERRVKLQEAQIMLEEALKRSEERRVELEAYSQIGETLAGLELES